MSFSYVRWKADEMIEEARRTGGEQAANEAAHGILGSQLGAMGGMIGGAAVGTAILPGVGTVVGAAAGALFGLVKGGEDKTLMDNANTAANMYKKAFKQ
jgi:uncharacterized membrane protein